MIIKSLKTTRRSYDCQAKTSRRSAIHKAMKLHKTMTDAYVAGHSIKYIKAVRIYNETIRSL